MSRQKEKEKHNFKTKLKIFIIILIATLTAFYFYGRYVGTTGLLINEHKIVNKQIPESFNGLTIVQFSDLHYGRTINEKELENIVKQINKLNPDIVLFTGDLIDKDVTTTTEMETSLTKELSKINATVGKYAIVGNHDYKNKFYSKIMTDSAFTLLINNYDIVYYKGLTPILIGGVGDYLYKDSNIDSIMDYYKTNPDLYTIIMVHEPDYMTTLKNYKIDLVLAGHSHGGQVKLPLIGKLYTPNGAKIYYKSYYKVNDMDLYISSGIGCSTLNVRLFDRPAINYFRLANK